jgi:hypothetical protein
VRYFEKIGDCGGIGSSELEPPEDTGCIDLKSKMNHIQLQYFYNAQLLLSSGQHAGAILVRDRLIEAIYLDLSYPHEIPPGALPIDCEGRLLGPGACRHTLMSHAARKLHHHIDPFY